MEEFEAIPMNLYKEITKWNIDLVLCASDATILQHFLELKGHERLSQLSTRIMGPESTLATQLILFIFEGFCIEKTNVITTNLSTTRC
jgi:hypothetical protein